MIYDSPWYLLITFLLQYTFKKKQKNLGLAKVGLTFTGIVQYLQLIKKKKKNADAVAVFSPHNYNNIFISRHFSGKGILLAIVPTAKVQTSWINS